MRGFLSRATVDEALAWLDAHLSIGAATPVSLEEATGRVLAGDVISPIAVPGFDRSAMDGYALRGAETTGAGPYNPLNFAIVGESLPGRPCEKSVGPGEAVRIMTGAPLPEGADAVLPAEYATEAGTKVDVTTTVAPEKHVGRRGEDIAEGTTALQRGRLLRPQDVGLLASLGIPQIEVVKAPLVRLIVTGEELALPGQTCSPHQIYEANSFLLRGLIARDGGVIESIRRLPDKRDELRAALTESGADVILVSGGSSVGAEDFAPTIISEVGELAIHGIAMRPSSPTGIGRIGDSLVVLLPGNPVSCLCAYDFFAGRAIRTIGGRKPEWPYRRSQVDAVRKIVSQVGRVDYCRVRRVDGGIAPVAISGASMLSSTTQADGFVIVPAPSEGLAEGTPVDVFWYDD